MSWETIQANLPSWGPMILLVLAAVFGLSFVKKEQWQYILPHWGDRKPLKLPDPVPLDPTVAAYIEHRKQKLAQIESLKADIAAIELEIKTADVAVKEGVR